MGFSSCRDADAVDQHRPQLRFLSYPMSAGQPANLTRWLSHVPKVTVAVTLVACAFLALIGGWGYVQLGGGGWQPDLNSVYALRARQVDSELHVGMTYKQLDGLFQADVEKNPADSYAGDSELLPDIVDLTIKAPPRYPWDSDGTWWTVEASFYEGRLVKHRVFMERCCPIG